MEGKIIIIFLAIMVAMVPLIAADDTRITVKTLPGYNYTVSLTILNPDTEDAYMDGMFENTTDSAGDAFFTYSSASKRIGFSIIVRQNGRIAFNKKLGINSTTVYNTGGSITLNLFETQPVTTTTSPVVTGNVINTSNNTNITNNSANTVVSNNKDSSENTKKDASIFSSLSDIKINWKNIFKWVGYVIGAIIALFVIIILFKFIIKAVRNNLGAGSFTKKSEDIVVDKNTARQLSEAERKIKEAQETIDYIKNKKNKVAEAERRFEEARKELEKIKGN
jgi:hypothetical protein